MITQIRAARVSAMDTELQGKALSVTVGGEIVAVYVTCWQHA